ncbi:MAG: DUF4412 domain-containing protein [Bacteroidales bacterium]|nr:DUF4412 domain-containing protein [Bacteroidales bacterium]
MKHMIITVLLVCFVSSSADSQKTVLGTVDYKYNLKGENAQAMAGMMPEKMVIKYGDNGVVVEMKGGMMSGMMGKTVVNGKTGEAFMVREAEKVIYVVSNEEIQAEAEKVEKPEIEEFDDTREILGYNCRKYVQTVNADGMSMSQTIWVTKDLKSPDYKGDAFLGMGMSAQNTFYYDIDGFPMLIEVDAPGMPVTIELEVTNIEFGKIAESEFEKPAGYTVKPFSDMMSF